MFTYSLEPYRGKASRHTCPQCDYKMTFVRYVHSRTNEYLSHDVGRCNREVNCGYHRTPAQYYAERGPATSIPAPQPTVRVPLPPPPLPGPATYHTDDHLMATAAGYLKNCFVKFLLSRFTREQVHAALLNYEIGTCNHWPGATVFWQRDVQGNIRFGKVMLYNPHTGKRVKHPFPHFTTMHRVLGLKNFNFRQCLFGEHLLANNTKPVAIVESEKTAIIASMLMPDRTWLATGGLSGLSAAKCAVLKGRSVMLFPDLNAHEQWLARAAELAHIAPMIVSTLLHHQATDTERAQGLDLGDYLLQTA